MTYSASSTYNFSAYDGTNVAFEWIAPKYSKTIPKFFDVIDPARFGYTFIGWSTTKSVDDLVGDMTVFYDAYGGMKLYELWQASCATAYVGDLRVIPLIYSDGDWKKIIKVIPN